MTNEELANFFIESNNVLEQIIVDNDNIEYDELEAWKQDVVKKLHDSYKIKMNRLEILIYHGEIMYIDTLKYNSAKTILRDMYFKYNIKKKKTKTNIETEKLLKAREKNIDFELELASMITGDNSSFPYRSSSKLTNFFQNLGYNFTHNGETRRDWVKDRLNELNIIEIHNLLSQGLFKKKYFKEYSEKLNNDTRNNMQNNPDVEQYIVTIEDCIHNAKKEFKDFIINSIKIDDAFDLSTVLDMNINVELLFDNKADTEDKELNKLIEDAKDRFLNRNDKQVALEKLWDAFERLKTYFLELDKKESANRIVDTISKGFDKNFINDEFKKLTNIGNDYRIRHHEQNKLELTNIHINYFFFRMLTLIDLCLVYLNEENEKL